SRDMRPGGVARRATFANLRQRRASSVRVRPGSPQRPFASSRRPWSATLSLNAAPLPLLGCLKALDHWHHVVFLCVLFQSPSNRVVVGAALHESPTRAQFFGLAV